ncbi:MAG: hypothetical protein AYK18_00680 [Theionarchaea archaeon DG-70]|nr:MAG: hypothetical protein AYK18_00680 [Theionarchaea archaeon DG-70]
MEESGSVCKSHAFCRYRKSAAFSNFLPFGQECHALNNQLKSMESREKRLKVKKVENLLFGKVENENGKFFIL